MADLPSLALLRSFIALGQELSFRRAAERLALDQSTFSRRIQKLEDAIGFALFERTTHDVALTAAGAVFLQSAVRIIGDFQKSVADAQLVAEGRSGKVRIGYMSFSAISLMPTIVAQFEARFPDVRLEMKYLATQRQKIALSNGEIDVGLLIGPYENSDCQSVVVSDEPLYLILPMHHPLTKQMEIQPEQITDLRLILGDSNEWGEYRDRLVDLFGARGLTLLPTLEASNTLGLIGLVAAGMGVTIYPKSLVRWLGGGIEARPIANLGWRVRTVLTWLRTNHSRAVSNFANIALKVSQDMDRGLDPMDRGIG